MITAFHIYSLIQGLKREIIGAEIVASEFYKKDRAAYLFIKGKPRLAFCFLYHPARHGSFLLPASKVKITTREKPWPIFELEGAIIKGINQLGFDRLFEIHITKNNLYRVILIEAIGANGNMYYLDENKNQLATLRKKDSFQKGERYQPKLITDRLNPLDLTIDSLKKAISENTDLSLTRFIEKNIAGCSFQLAREIVQRSNIEINNLNEISIEQIKTIINVIRTLLKQFDEGGTSYLYQVGQKYEAFPFKMKTLSSEPEKFKSLSQAMMASSEKRQNDIESDSEEKIISNAVKKNIKKLEKRLKKIEKDIIQAADYESYKIQGELLQINFSQIKKGMTSIEVDNVYNDQAEKLSIKLKPDLSPNENAEAYFKKYRKGKEGLALLQRRLEITNGEINQMLTIQSELESNFDAAKEKYSAELLAMLPKHGEAHEGALRLPYREYQLSTGLTIYVGRDGSDNDRTTFDFAKPYELWFHTQQCPGSHVVMKFPNKSFEPSKKEIEETAAIAAFFSKAKNDSMVPVCYAPRKYVRKPRKAKPGLVSVEREKSIMVIPTKPTG